MAEREICQGEETTVNCGAGHGMTTLVGVGLKIEGNKRIVEIEDLIIKRGKEM